MRKRMIMSAVVVLMALLIWGCSNRDESKQEAAEEYVIGVVAKSGTSEYWMSVRSGMEAAAKKYGARVMFFAPEAEDNLEAQEKYIDELLKRKVDVLAISPIDAFGEPTYVKLAKDKGVPIVAFDSAYADLDIPYIGIDNEQAGYEMAKYLAKKLDYSGEIGIVSGELNQMCHKERVAGARRYIDSQPDMQIAYVESGYSGAKMSGEIIAAQRQKYPGVKGLVVTSAVTALGIIESSEAGTMKIVSIDVQKDAILALKNKRISGLVAQSGYDIGYETVRYVDALRKGEAKENQVVLDADFLTPENVEGYLEEYTY
ncbi:ribose transport system substrate-binding protein [Lachnospiraceae bacterium PFB1-21]